MSAIPGCDITYPDAELQVPGQEDVILRLLDPPGEGQAEAFEVEDQDSAGDETPRLLQRDSQSVQ